MRTRLISKVMVALILAAGVLNVLAQDKVATPSPQPSDSSSQAKNAGGHEYLGPTADTIRPYRPANRDPFKRTPKQKIKAVRAANAMKTLGFPSLEVRRAEFKRKVEEARSRDLPEPNPVSQYLITELDVTGIYRDDQGYGAFVRSQPTGTMFFVRNGTKCSNGEVLRITGEDGDGSPKVMFREVSYTEVNGKNVPQERVITKVPAGKSN